MDKKLCTELLDSTPTIKGKKGKGVCKLFIGSVVVIKSLYYDQCQ